ncbi:MAG TPA: helix-turn-helix transcriptional regulator [Puia sp.]
MGMQEIGNILRKRREFLNLRQEDLSEMSQVTIKTIQLIEHGKGNPSLKTLEKLMAILGMAIDLHVKQLNSDQS